MKKVKLVVLLSLIFLIVFVNLANAQEKYGATDYFNVVSDFGAINDGKTSTTEQVQAAIDAAHANGGGTVYFPPGQYSTGSLMIKDNVTILLDNGALLQGSIRGSQVKNVAIIGQRVRNLNGMIWIEDGEYVLIQGIVLSAIEVNGSCRFVDVRDCQITGGHGIGFRIKLDARGVDFKDPEMLAKTPGHALTVTNTVIKTTDDCSHLHGSDILFHNCVFTTGVYAFKFTEANSIKNMVVSNCIFKDIGGGIFQFQTWGGTVVDGITMTGCLVDNVNQPFLLTVEDEGIIKNFHVDNVTMTNSGRSYISAQKGGHIENFVFNNVDLSGGLSAHGNGINGLEFHNTRITSVGDQPGLVISDVTDLVLNGVSVKGLQSGIPAFDLNQVNGAFVSSNKAASGTNFARLSGDKTSSISLLNNDLHQARVPLEILDEVPVDAIYPNAYVEYVKLDSPDFVASREEFDVNVTLTNKGVAGVENVVLRVGERDVASRWVWLEPGQTSTVTFSILLYDSGELTLEAGPLAEKIVLEASLPF